MDQVAALARFQAHCPPDSDPPLSWDIVDDCISAAVTADADGVLPSESGWVPTYSRRGIWLAIVRGWEAKASAAADRFDFTTDGQSFRRSQVIDHCEARAATYRRRLSQSVGAA